MERGRLDQSAERRAGDFAELWTKPAASYESSARRRLQPRSPSAKSAANQPRLAYRSDRDIVYRSDALTARARAAAQTGRPLILLTAAHSRLSLAVTMMLTQWGMRWVVEIEGEFFDGLSAELLDPADEPVPTPAIGPRPSAANQPRRDQAPPLVEQFVVSATVHHRAAAGTELGRSVERLAQALTGAPPTGWGLGEPVDQQWNRANLTTEVRRAMPDPTVLAVVGHHNIRPFAAQLRATRTQRGVDEDFVAVTRAEPHATRDGLMQTLAGLTADTTVAFALVHRRLGPADLTTEFGPPHPSTPIAVLFGPRAVRELGLDCLESAPVRPPQRVGRERVPSLLWTLGEGAAASQGQGWQELGQLVRHLGPERVAAATGSDQLQRQLPEPLTTKETHHG
ncbi:MAG: hypothetical protein JWO63_2565 [Frankiales bacterium]|nr:hypothetical protein [Frankiales bacterium]